MLRLHRTVSFFLLLLITACSSRTGSETATALVTPAAQDTAVLTVSPQAIGGSIRLTDGLGEILELPAPAQRIVTLSPSNTEIVFALGGGDRLVGRDSFSDYPPEAAQVKEIGGSLGNLDTEAILALKPDLVLAASLTDPQQVKALRELGLNVFSLTNPVDFDGIYINLITVATLIGKEDQAQTLIHSLKERVVAVEAKLAGVESRPLVFYELDGTDPSAPWTSGPGTFIDNLILAAGGRNFGHELKGDWVQVSIEELLRQDPDLILLGDATWGGVTVESVAARNGWDALKAVKNNQVLPFDDNLVSRPGPRIVDGLEAMAALLHPDLFKP